MLFASLYAENFLGLREVDVELGRVTCVWGANGAGKSSLADAIAHAITGDLGRADDVKQLVRVGSKKSADVTVMLPAQPGGDRIGFGRRRTPSGKGEALFCGVVTKEEEFTNQVLGHLGADRRTILAALRSGALLEQSRGELIGTLLALTGGRAEAEAIEAAFGATAGAAQRVALTLPTTLAGFGDAAKRAEQARVEMHRRAEALRARIAGRPALDPELAAKAQGTTLAAVDGVLRGLRADVEVLARGQQAAEAYAAGRYEEKQAAIAARVAELQAVAKPAGDAPDDAALRATATQARKALAAAEAEVERLTDALATASARAEGVRELPADAAELPAMLAAAEAEVKAGEAILAAGQREGGRLAAMVQRAAAGSSCETCGHDIGAEDVERLGAKLQAARDSYVTLQRVHAKTVAERDGLRTRVAEVAAVNARGAAAAEAEALKVKLAAARDAAATRKGEAVIADAKVDAVASTAAAWAAWRSAQKEIGERLAEQARLASMKAPAVPSGDLAGLRERIAKGEQVRAAVVSLGELAALEQELAAIDAQWTDADAVAKACGPKGVQAGLLAACTSPFTDAANEALAALAPEFRVAVSGDDFGIVVQRGDVALRPAQLSDGERTRLLYVLQFAVAKLAKVPFLVLDRTELLDDTGKAGLRRLMGACLAAGIQVLMLSCSPAPAAVPPGVVGYRMQDGTAERIAAVGAQAAA